MPDAPIRVLVLDDEELVLETLACFLEDQGYDVHTATTGEKALDLLTHVHPDLAIVDMRLPGFDGNAFILKAHRLQPRLRFLIHTGSADYLPPPPLAALGIGNDNVFHKPVRDLRDFIRAIERQIAAEDRDT